MPAPYTCPVLSFTVKEDKVDLVAASHINDVQTEIEAINNRLLNLIDSDGSLLSGASFPSPTLPSQVFYRTDTNETYIRNAANTSWALIASASNIQIFTSNGTFVAPSGITKVYLTMLGGGGGGATRATNRGGGGGAGGMVINYPYTVVAGNSYNVTVGSGGAGGATGAPNDGANGSASTFDSTITAPGGNKGLAVGTAGAGGGQGWDASTSSAGGYAHKGGNGSDGGSGTGGHGGGTLAGAGGTGATSSPGGSGSANTGSGGGGSTTDSTAGNGGSGIVIVMY